MTLTAPEHLRGRMTKWTPQPLLDERADWAVTAGKQGYSAGCVGEALGISQFAAQRIMRAKGWQWWLQRGHRIFRPRGEVGK
ncbi:MAG: hypothetical protein QM656_03390 [Paracoccaceae bacterium]